MPFPGALTGLLAGGFVGLTFATATLGRPDGFSYARAYALIPLLAAFGLIYDIWRVRAPRFWQSAYPDRLWMSWLFKTTLYWTIAFPLARLVQDLATYWELVGHAPNAAVGGPFAHLSDPLALVGFVVFQAVFGSGFGIVFTILYRRLQR